jgi:hypothetical protein
MQIEFIDLFQMYWDSEFIRIGEDKTSLNKISGFRYIISHLCIKKIVI